MKYKVFFSILLGFFLINIATSALAACWIVQKEELHYYGTTSCSRQTYIYGEITITDTIATSPTREVILRTSYHPGIGGGGPVVHVECIATLPHSGMRTVSTEVCDEPEVVAVADINDDDMDILDSNCRWNGWSGHTMGRSNDLYCHNKRVATVTQLTGEPYRGDCSASFNDSNYFREYPNSKNCYIPIFRK